MFAITIGILSLSATTFNSVSAADPIDPGKSIQGGIDASGGNKVCKDDGKVVDCLQQSIRTVVNVLLYVIGAVAVIMIVIGGIRYTTSNGDSSQVTSAKNTILYAVVGLVVAMLAYAIVNFVVGAF